MAERVISLEAEIRELATMVKPEPAKVRNAIRLLREEARDNHRMLKLAAKQGQYWKLSGDAPATKQWKKHHDLLRDEAGFPEGLYEQGRVAAQEVERILLARSRQMFGKGRRVDGEERVPEVVQLLEDYERHLSVALDGV